MLFIETEILLILCRWPLEKKKKKIVRSKGGAVPVLTVNI